MYDNRSHYGLNKSDSDAIVYADAEGTIIRLTRADFDTEADFLKWKAWSDRDYHDEEKANHVEENHTVSMSDLPNKSGSVAGPEIVIEQRHEKREKEQYTAEMVIRVRCQLTEKQFRRIWLHYVDGLRVEAIAQREGKVHSSISESISRARKKISDFFSKNPTKRP